MVRSFFFGIVVGFSSFNTFGQSFEVTSVKPADPTAPRLGSGGGPVSGRFTCGSCTISQLIVSAYGLRPHQLPEAKSLGTDRFAVSAKVPPGTTQDEFKR